MKRIKACLLFICVTLLLSSCQISKADAKDKHEIVGDVLENIVKGSEEKKEIQQQHKENHLNGYNVSVRARDMKQVEKEHRWSLIDSYIFEKFRKKEKDEEKYKDVTTKLTNITLEDPAIVAISTPIMNSDPKAKEYAAQIQKEVEALFQSKKMKKLIEGDAYKIVVYDEQDQPIN